MNELLLWERWFVDQIRLMPGGLAQVDRYPDAPIKSTALSMVGRGRRLRLADAMWLARTLNRPELFTALANMIGEPSGPGDLVALARVDGWDSTDLARTVETALQDGHVSAADLAEIGRAVSQNTRNAARLQQRFSELKTGPLEGEGGVDG